ncbi:MAG TPA: hypothetical protein DHW71_08620 [Gammaproteobacteria bacterium]|nr:hypothetical protein [Gammaproteobacteria bacterium]HBF06666.1 hypothetical protein [Gammaproteobacteria bacterium]HCK93036.1 hypothetical protein [Gammaproteobacteria bacterium]|tara:strand:+ start:3224 stop:3745 length:522 start_codon:yes stop_codon:yes gene_type:complete
MVDSEFILNIAVGIVLGVVALSLGPILIFGIAAVIGGIIRGFWTLIIWLLKLTVALAICAIVAYIWLNLMRYVSTATGSMFCLVFMLASLIFILMGFYTKPAKAIPVIASAAFAFSSGFLIWYTLMMYKSQGYLGQEMVLASPFMLIAMIITGIWGLQNYALAPLKYRFQRSH